MTSRRKRTSRPAGKILAGAAWLLAAFSLPPDRSACAAQFSVSGESSTYLRLMRSTDDKEIYPLYEYLRLSLETPNSDGSATSLNLGGWGRLDLADSWNGDHEEAELQYGYLSHRSGKNNLVINAGRQFITEGVAAERLDGLHLRSDLAHGFSGALFVGSPVVTEPDFSGGELLYGGRLAHAVPERYYVGVSALRNQEDGDGLREEEGIDLWIRPLAQLELTGRSSYSSATSGWMEHSYALSYTPADAVSLGADFSRVNYDDYFHHVTTNALSLSNGIIRPGEELTTAGVRGSYSPFRNLTLSAQYRNYHYSLAGDADYVGAGAGYAITDSLVAGFSVNRMYGDTDRLRYIEYRLYALKKLGAVDVAAEFFNVNYDRRINGVKNSFALTGSAGYRFNERLRVWGDLEYGQNPDFDDELRGLVKLAYAFDMTGSTGRKKSEN